MAIQLFSAITIPLAGDGVSSQVEINIRKVVGAAQTLPPTKILSASVESTFPADPQVTSLLLKGDVVTLTFSTPLPPADPNSSHSVTLFLTFETE